MRYVAGLLRKANDGVPFEQVRAEIKDLLVAFQVLHYSFDSADV